MPIVLSGSTGISGVDGTASQPAYVGVDTNTGIFFPAADTIAFVEGGTEAIRINNNATVSIGATAYIPSINDGPIAGSRNRIINGDMRIDQRNAGASVVPTSTGIFTLDRWQAWEATDGAATVQRSGVAPVGFTSSLLWTTTTADASLAAGQFAEIIYVIEGFNISDLNWGTVNAQPVTLSFWTRSSLTGTFGGSIRNPTLNRSYPFTYTISSANTFEYKTVTIPGDTTGTWGSDNSAGMTLFFTLGAGSTYSGTAGSWASADYHTATGAVSVIGTLNATFYLTGVQLEAGTVATPFERRSYGQELALCQRYYYKPSVGFDFSSRPHGFDNATNRDRMHLLFPTVMRSTPNITINTPNLLKDDGTGYGFGVTVASSATAEGIKFWGAFTSQPSAGVFLSVEGLFFNVSAEL